MAFRFALTFSDLSRAADVRNICTWLQIYL